LGTKFTYAFVPSIDLNGMPFLKNATGSFQFKTARFLLGLRTGRWIATIALMSTPDEDKRPFLSATMDGKVSYSLKKIKIPIKKNS
jgi:hypothetical protein